MWELPNLANQISEIRHDGVGLDCLKPPGHSDPVIEQSAAPSSRHIDHLVERIESDAFFFATRQWSPSADEPSESHVDHLERIEGSRELRKRQESLFLLRYVIRFHLIEFLEMFLFVLPSNRLVDLASTILIETMIREIGSFNLYWGQGGSLFVEELGGEGQGGLDRSIVLAADHVGHNSLIFGCKQLRLLVFMSEVLAETKMLKSTFCSQHSTDAFGTEN